MRIPRGIIQNVFEFYGNSRKPLAFDNSSIHRINRTPTKFGRTGKDINDNILSNILIN